ncbi:MAG: type I restriction endonuclease [Candidatus Competibacteraceae bacterium]
MRHAQAQVIDFRKPTHNRFLAVRGAQVHRPARAGYNRRADLVCFVNGLPLVFIELKAVYQNIRAGFEGNLKDYLNEHVIAHAFHHNAFLIVSNGHRAATAPSPARGNTSPNGSGWTSATRAA